MSLTVLRIGERVTAFFWSLRQNWPVDPAGYVFLGRAVNRLGEKLDPEWSGQEPALAELYWRRKDGPVVPKKPPTSDIDTLVSNLPKLDITEKINEAELASRRWQRLKRSIATRCEAGQLLTFGRPLQAGCTVEGITKALGIGLPDLFDNKRTGRVRPFNPSTNRATAQPSGLKLDAYAAAKHLPLEFLRGCGLSEISYEGRTAVRIPYFGPTGELLATRFRIALEGDRFRWKSGSKPQLYGLTRLDEARGAGQVVLVEGESDVHTFWHHDIPAVGIPGAASWREERDAHRLDGIEKIYVIIEPDQGGETMKKWIAQSEIRHRLWLITLPVKDPSALHLESETEFKERWQVACREAVAWTAHEHALNAEEKSEAWKKCADLAQSNSILDLLDQQLMKLGLVGERRSAKLIYLAVTSRLLDRPVSVAVKGPSSGGKSYITESVLKLFPQSAFYALTAMSDRALAYSSEPLRHRHLVIYEAAGMASEFATYLIRSLLSEGRRSR